MAHDLCALSTVFPSRYALQWSAAPLQSQRDVRIQITAYAYALEDALTTHELFAYHWHPGTRNSVAFPHLHIGPASGKLRDEYARAHMDTGHIALPTMLHLIIRDFAVDPVRIDWLSVLTQTRAFWDTAVSYEE